MTKVSYGILSENWEAFTGKNGSGPSFWEHIKVLLGKRKPQAIGKLLREILEKLNECALQFFKWTTSLTIHGFHYVDFRCATSKLPTSKN